MASVRCSVCAMLCLLLLMWAYRDVEGRPLSPPHDERSGYWMPNGSVTINTGPAVGGTVNIVVYPWVGQWSYGRNGSAVDILQLSTVSSTTTTPKPAYQGTTGRTTHVTANHHVKPTQPPSTTIGVEPIKIIIAPPIPRECPDGEKPDMSNNCREEWPDFSRSVVGKSQLTSRSTPTPKSTTRTSPVAHHTRKLRL